MDLVTPEHGITVCLDPNACHGVVKDLVVFNDTQPSVVDQNATVLSAPDLVALDQRVTARPGATAQCLHKA